MCLSMPRPRWSSPRSSAHPVEFRADLVLELRDAEGATVLALVLEVQRDQDPDKKYSWPVYVAVVRARKRVGAAVLVGARQRAERARRGSGCARRARPARPG